MKAVKIILWILAFLAVGAIGFFLGSAGGLVAGVTGGGIGGTVMGACRAAQVAVEKGILTPEQQAALINATAEALRSEYADLLKQVEISPELKLTPENCPAIIQKFKPTS